jgi:uncharacterized protein YegP (UPF0339 family)
MKEQVKFFEVHKAENGEYVMRKPWSNGRL